MFCYDTKKEMMLPKGVVIGSVHSVSAVMPLVNLGGKCGGESAQVASVKVTEVVETERLSRMSGEDTTTSRNNLVPVSNADDGALEGVPEVGANEQDQGCGTRTTTTESEEPLWDLSHLNGEQKELMEKVLVEEIDVFAKDNNDIGDIPNFQMPINVIDDIPVTAAYRRIPPQLYNEVRNYTIW